MAHDCKFEDLVIEMSGNIKMLVAEFKTMNGVLKETKHKADKTEKVTIRHGVYWAVLIFVIVSLVGVARFWVITRADVIVDDGICEGHKQLKAYEMKKMKDEDLHGVGIHNIPDGKFILEENNGF